MLHNDQLKLMRAINHNAPRTRLLAGVSLPDNPLITAMIEYAKRLSEPYLFNHAMRSWLFAEAIGRLKELDYDQEVVAIGTILHDIGLTASVSGSNRFEVNGADAALSIIRGKGISDRRAQLIWDLIAFNSTPSLALHKEPEVAVGTMGIGLDYGGFGIEALPASDVERIVNAYPRLRMKQRFTETCCRLVTAKPETSYDNFLRGFGERFMPGYKAFSTVDVLMNARSMSSSERLNRAANVARRIGHFRGTSELFRLAWNSVFETDQSFVRDFQSVSRSAINSARCRSSRPSRMLRSWGLARK
jgi:hypothetical protein